MTQENKDLLIKDLCKRLPYGVVIQTWYNKRINIKCVGVNVYTNVVELDIPEDDEAKVYIDNVKPYLFPLSSMTDEQKKTYNWLKHSVFVCHYEYGDVVEEIELYDSPESFEYLIENHFDVNGLIEKGLAIDATNKNIY